MAWKQQSPSGRWRGMYRGPNGKSKSAGTFDTIEEAIAAAEAEEEKLKSGDRPPSKTWGEWVDEWTDSIRQVEEGTAARDQSRIETIRARWGHIELTDITHHDIQDWMRSPAIASKAASTQKKILSVLRASLRDAKRHNPPLIEMNPAIDIATARQVAPPDRWLNKDEVAALRKAIAPEHLATYELLVGTGLRFGEAVGLHWDDVHLEKGNERVDVKISYDSKVHKFKLPKTDQVRTVPITGQLAELLRTRKRELGTGELPTKAYAPTVTKPRQGLVLSPNGQPRDSRQFNTALKAAARVSVVKDSEGQEYRIDGEIRPHDLRHTYASNLVQRGVPLLMVKKLLGHASITTTERYARASQDGFDAVRAAAADIE